MPGSGVYPLKGARVKALDLRGGAALAVAALGAEGKTVIEDCSHIVRGYEDICRDINALGGKISWMEVIRDDKKSREKAING